VPPCPPADLAGLSCKSPHNSSAGCTQHPREAAGGAATTPRCDPFQTAPRSSHGASRSVDNACCDTEIRRSGLRAAWWLVICNYSGKRTGSDSRRTCSALVPVPAAAGGAATNWERTSRRRAASVVASRANRRFRVSPFCSCSSPSKRRQIDQHRAARARVGPPRRTVAYESTCICPLHPLAQLHRPISRGFISPAPASGYGRILGRRPHVVRLPAIIASLTGPVHSGLYVCDHAGRWTAWAGRYSSLSGSPGSWLSLIVCLQQDGATKRKSA
jgi:hypothetical protein